MVAGPLGFRDVELIGVGATSRVYRAFDVRNKRSVALKRLHRQLVPSEEALARLRRELEALATLKHPAIVSVFDVVRWEHDPTIVMELVDGEDLKVKIERERRLDPSEVERLARRLFDVLGTVHAAGIVHRDVKPQNVRIRGDGALVLLDFGSARLDAASSLTKTGSTVGTPEYMAPELFVGPVYDPRADVYGVGATLYECLTGRPPHTADTLAELALKRSETPAPPLPREVPRALAQVVERCLRIDAGERYPTAAMAVYALDHPEEERLLVARRGGQPLCVHCGAAIAPEAGGCAECLTPDPFRLTPGGRHVMVDAAESGARLVEWVAAIAPERSGEGHVAGLARRVAELRKDKLRLVSFVSEADAHHLVKSLGAVGVRAHVEREGLRAADVLTLLALGFGVFQVGGAVLAAASIAVAHAAGRLLARTNDLLSPPARRKWLAGPTRLAAPALVAGAALTPWAAARFDAMAFGGAWWAGLVALAGLAAAALAIARPDGPPAPGPEPTTVQSLGALLSAVFRGKREVTPTAGKIRPVIALTVLALGVALVPLELSAIGWLAGELLSAPAFAGAAASPFVPTPRPRGTRRDPTSGDPRFSDTTRTKPGETPSRATRRERRSSRPSGIASARAVLSTGLGLAAPALALLGLIGLLRRRRRISRDQAEVLAALDPEVVLQNRRRLAPTRGGQKRLAPAALSVRAGDPFVERALVRFAELAPLVAPSSLERALTVARAVPPGATARHILETDESHRLRFQLLELEAELEAEAARRWAARLAKEP